MRMILMGILASCLALSPAAGEAAKPAPAKPLGTIAVAVAEGSESAELFQSLLRDQLVQAGFLGVGRASDADYVVTATVRPGQSSESDACLYFSVALTRSDALVVADWVQELEGVSKRSVLEEAAKQVVALFKARLLEQSTRAATSGARVTLEISGVSFSEQAALKRMLLGVPGVKSISRARLSKKTLVFDLAYAGSGAELASALSQKTLETKRFHVTRTTRFAVEAALRK